MRGNAYNAHYRRLGDGWAVFLRASEFLCALAYCQGRQKSIEDILNEAGLTPELIAGELKKLIQDNDKDQKQKAIRTAAEIMGLIGKGGVIASQVNIGQGLIFTKEEEEELCQIRQKYGV